MSGRFPKSRRLRKRREFLRVYRRGKLYPGEHLKLYVLRQPGPRPDAPARLGLAVGRSVGRAAVRNRIKRVVREAFRLNADRFAGLEVVIQVRPSAARLSRKALRRAIWEDLRRWWEAYSPSGADTPDEDENTDSGGLKSETEV